MKKLKDVYLIEDNKIIKKIDSNQLKKLILEVAREIDIMDEKADPDKVDPKRFPTNLSDVDPDFAKKAVQSTPSPEDSIPVVGDQEAVQNLKPSQTSMNIDKAMAQAISMILGDMELGGNIDAFISSDDHIMDGHHRWVATAMVDPSKPVGGYRVDFPGDKLIAILNAITVGKFGITQGKPATGGFEQFKEGPVRATLKKFATEGIPGKYPRKPKDVMKAIELFVKDSGETGDDAVDVAADKMVKNLASLEFKTPPGAPSRPNMPVIDKPDPAIKALTAGEVDVNPPYQVDPDEETKNESTKPKDRIVMERWRRLAGLDKEVL